MAITTRTLGEAARVAGLELTAAERRQARPRVERLIEGYETVRARSLENGEAPATTFDPRLPGMRFEGEQRPLVRSRGRLPRLPESDEEIAFAPVTRLARWIERRELTSLRLTRIYIERLKRHGPRLECTITLLEQPALAAAGRADRQIARGRYRGPLHGIPWGAKDLLDTAGVPTTWGATPYRERVPDGDAAVVRRLSEAGAVLIAKLTLGALANGDVWFDGRTRNPFDLEEGSSGSSAGSASATAAGLVGFAIGSETLGSIISPSQICGTAGLRPTFGRVSRAGAMALAWSMDKLGPICRTVEDTALVLDAIARPERAGEPRDASLIEAPLNLDARRTARGLRVGYVRGGLARSGAEARARAVLDQLRAEGVELVRIPRLEFPVEALMPALWVEAAASFDELTRSDHDDELVRQSDGAWPNSFRSARFVPAVELVQADRLRRRLMVEIHELFERHDLDATVEPPGPLESIALATNFTGHPSLTLRVAMAHGPRTPDRPTAVVRSVGVPIAVNLTGRLFDEGTLLRLGMALERQAGVWDVRPRLPEPGADRDAAM